MSQTRLVLDVNVYFGGEARVTVLELRLAGVWGPRKTGPEVQAESHGAERVGWDSSGRERRQSSTHTGEQRDLGEQRRKNQEPPSVLLQHKASHFPFKVLGVRG